MKAWSGSAWTTAYNTGGGSALIATNNLSDLTNTTTARTNLGLGGLATVTPGTGVTTALGNAVNASGGFITYSTYAPASGKTLTVSNSLTLAGVDGKSATFNNSLTFAGTDSTTMTFPSASASIGYLNIPQVGGAAKTSSYNTQTLADSGQLAVMNGASLTYTIPANSSVAYPVGTVLTIANIYAGNLTIAITTDTMTLAGGTSTGNRTLAQNGVATAVKVTSTSWIISGAGLT
jgi:hypothetical protein